MSKISQGHCEHKHGHHHHEYNNKKSLLIVLFITAIYMVAEFLGGYFTNSLALTADAGHMLGDVGALGLSFFALWLASKKAPVEKTYGYYRAEIFAAFINGITLVFIALAIIYEAYYRITIAQKIDAVTMTIIAIGGLLVNIAGACVLRKGSKENLNVKGAFLHILGDLLGSIGAITAGILVYGWHIYIADPIVSIIIAILVLYSSINITNSAVQILMESAPKHIDIQGVNDSICEVEGILNVHDLHVWSINSSSVSLSVHIVAELSDYERILCEINRILKEKFNIHHSTIQIEPKDFHENKCSLNLC
ncbi:MAG: cation diffusion facilitator family transporter [Candidatus Gastranaerophilaceae bacterium]